MDSRLGLNQTAQKPDGPVRVRTAPKGIPKRDGPIWKTVTVVKEHPTTPSVQCINCNKTFCGGATRIGEHITGVGSIAACTCETESFLELKQKLIDKKDEDAGKKTQKAAEREVEDASVEKKPKLDSDVKPFMGKQLGIKTSFESATAVECDEEIAKLFYACNIPPAIIDHPQFKKAMAVMKMAPASYKLPNRQRLTEDLINFLVGTAKGFFFDGTIKLTSEDSEDAQRVADLICAEIEKVGKLNIIQVVTDTCSVMKSAWKKIEAKFPWITCTCCGPHVLSLELKDIGNIKEVSDVIKIGRAHV